LAPSSSTTNVYPNPAIDDLNIELKRDFNYQVSLVDLLGSTVLEIQNAKTISATTLPSGIYLLVIRE